MTKDWQGRVLNHRADAGDESRVSSLVLVKMTLPLTLGIKWIVGSPINTSLKEPLSGCFKTVDEMIQTSVKLCWVSRNVFFDLHLKIRLKKFIEMTEIQINFP